MGLSAAHVDYLSSGPTNTITNTQSFIFDGSGDFLSLADADSDDKWEFTDGSASSTSNEKHSFSFWMKRDVANAPYGIISKYGGSGGNSYRHFYHTSANGGLFLDTYQGNQSYKRRVIENQFNTNWEHHVWAHDGNLTGWKLYINGVLQTDTNNTGGSGGEMVDTGTAILIGRAGGLNDLSGKMCQFMAWKGVELDLAAAKYLYAGGAAMRNPTTAGEQGVGSYTQAQANALLVWLPMDDTDGADDHSGGGYDFTKNGGCNVTTGTGNVPF